MASDQRSYVTTPIYYVNGAPHIGHAHTTVMGDILKRARKMRGVQMLLTTGTDEHGQKNEEAARASGLSVGEYLDQRSAEFKSVFDRLGVDYDTFVRTTRPYHMEQVAHAESLLNDQQLLIKKAYTGLYCTGCEQFKKDSDLTEDGRCKDHPNLVPEWTDEINYFFRIDPFRERLREHIRSNPNWIQPAVYANAVLASLEEPLEDLCISRPKSRVTLGVELPFDDNYVTYVWFDALINYLTNVNWPAPEYETWWRVAEHLIGKDIVKTHCVYWPCMLFALGVPLPKHVSVHGHWVGPGGHKMSKSLGNVVDPVEVIEAFGASTLRFYLARHTRAGNDSQVSLDLLQATYNAELGNKIGNLLMRCVSFARARYEGAVPAAELAVEDNAVRDKVLRTANDCLTNLESLESIPAAAAQIVDIANLLNDHVTSSAPWTLIKNPETEARARSVLFATLDGLRILFEALFPIMPEISGRGLVTLGAKPIGQADGVHDFSAGALASGTTLGEPVPLFPRKDA
jgi:methionyl-tRNA synthetase